MRSELRQTLAVLIVVAGTFAPALSADRVWDDHLLLEPTRLTDLSRVWTSPYLPGQDLLVSPYYRPVATTLMALEQALFADRNWAYHALSLGLYLLCVALVMWLARRLAPDRPTLAVWAGLIFGLHPVHVEPVVWISGQPDLLATAGVLAAAVASLANVVPLVPLGLGLLAWCSKESATPLPLAVMGLGLSRLGTMTVAERRRRALPTMLLLQLGLVAYLLVRRSILAGAGPNLLPLNEPLSHRPATAAHVLVASLERLLLPVQGCLEWEISRASQPVTLELVGVVVVLALFGMGLVRARRRARAGAEAIRPGLPLEVHGLGLFLVFMIPVSQIVTLDETVADRYLLLPSVGVSLAVASLLDAGVAWSTRRFHRSVGIVVVMGICGFLAFQSWRGLQPWKDEVGLLEHQRTCAPSSVRALTWLGEVYLRRQQPEQAKSTWLEALSLEPDSAHLRHELASLALEQGDAEAAWQILAASESKGPTRVAGLMLRSRVRDALGDTTGAFELLQEARAEAPDRPELLFDLGVLAFKLGRGEQMRASFEPLVILEPENAAAWNYLGIALAGAGELTSGAAAFRRAASLDPGLPGVWCNLARALEPLQAGSTERGLEEEITHARARCGE